MTKNKACCEGCDCAVCMACCPYRSVLAFMHKLTDHGVCPDVAAQVAACFVTAQCHCHPDVADLQIKTDSTPVPPKP